MMRNPLIYKALCPFHNMKRHSTMRNVLQCNKEFEGTPRSSGRGEGGGEKGTHPHKILIQTFQHLSTGLLNLSPLSTCHQ